MEYTVNYWGSHPDSNNDDCYTGTDHATRSEALAAFHSDANPLEDPSFMTISCRFIEIDGPDIHEVRANPLYNRREAHLDSSLEDNESTWERRMLHGVDES